MATAQPAPQQGGPVVVGVPREKLQGWTFDKLNFFLDFYTRYQRDELKQTGQPDRTNTEWLLRETLGMSTHSFIGHRNFIDLSADARIGWQDDYIDNQSEGNEGHNSQFVDFYNINAIIFGAGPAPLTVYARRDETVLDRAFASSIDSLLNEYGASVRTFQKVAPTTFRYFYRDQHYEDQVGTVKDNVKQHSFNMQTVWTSGRSQRLVFDYTFNHINEEQSFGFNDTYNRNDATFTHDFNFGNQYQNSLRSTGRFFSQDGKREQRLFRLNEQLSLQHSPTLESRYTLNLDSRSVQGQDQWSIQGSALVRHKLFESLITTAEVGGTYLSLPDDNFNTKQAFARVTFDYTKEVPLGHFLASVSGGLDYTSNSDRGSTVKIQDRPAVFADPFPVVLGGPNVEPNTVVVTNSSGLITYQEGTDYTVQKLKDRVELQRIVGGQIADGQAVLTSYAIGPEPSSTVTSFLGAVSGRYRIEEGVLQGLSIYGDFRNTTQTIASANPFLSPSDVRIYRFGSEYIRAPFTIGAEYKKQDSSISPFDSIRAWGRYDQRFGSRSILSIHTSYDRIDFTDQDITTDLFRALGEWRQGFGNGLDIRLRLLYRNERESPGISSQAFDQVFELNWINRQTRIFASVRNSIAESDNEDNMSQTFTFGLRRDF